MGSEVRDGWEGVATYAKFIHPKSIHYPPYQASKYLLCSIKLKSQRWLHIESFKERKAAPPQVSPVPFSPHIEVTHIPRYLTLYSIFPLIFLVTVNKNVKLTESGFYSPAKLSHSTCPTLLSFCAGKKHVLLQLAQLAAPTSLSPILSISFCNIWQPSPAGLTHLPAPGHGICFLMSAQLSIFWSP